MNIVIKNRLPELENLLEQRQSVSVMGMPGSGISLFLRELAATKLGKPIVIDVFGLTELSASGLFVSLADILNSPDKTAAGCKAELEKLAKEELVIVYFAGFDQLQHVLNAEFLQALNSLTRIPNVRLVFGLCVSLKKLIPDSAFDSGLRLFGNVYYLKPYNSEELRYWLKSYGPVGWHKRSDIQKILELSGGHVQLLLQLLENKPELSDGPNESIKLLCKNLYTQLLGPQRTVLRKVARNERRVEPDEYLVGIGMVRKEADHYRLFSPSFSEYLRGVGTKRLPVKERRLFLLLKKHMGYVVSKHQIIETVWGEEIVSDWALNALVYRLRKHPAFTAQNYTIENHKKLGYVLQKNF